MMSNHNTIFYNKQTNTFLQDNNAVTTQGYRNNKTIKHQWTIPPPNWHKCNIDAPRIASKKSTTISYVCKDNQRKILHLLGTTVGHGPILVAETLEIQEATRLHSDEAR